MAERFLGHTLEARNHRIESDFARTQSQAAHHCGHKIGGNGERSRRWLVVDGAECDGEKRRNSRGLTDIDIGKEMKRSAARSSFANRSGTGSRRFAQDTSACIFSSRPIAPKRVSTCPIADGRTEPGCSISAS
jgi:hypothetical protein